MIVHVSNIDRKLENQDQSTKFQVQRPKTTIRSYPGPDFVLASQWVILFCLARLEGSHNGSAAVLKTAGRKAMQVRVLSPPPLISANCTATHARALCIKSLNAQQNGSDLLTDILVSQIGVISTDARMAALFLISLSGPGSACS